jgi:hypothetical protein
MSGSTNIIQWNPGAVNQETDALYLADSQRAGGATDPSQFAAALANKAFYQWSTVLTALGTMMANKGYTISDANLANLINALSNIITNADLANSPALGAGTGTGPTAPNQSSADNSTHIANTNFVQTQVLGLNALIAALTAGTAHGVVGSGSYFKLPAWLGSFIIQFGIVSTPGSPTVGTLPIAFPNQFLSAHATAAATGGSSVSMFILSLSTFEVIATTMPTSVWWLAIGS